MSDFMLRLPVAVRVGPFDLTVKICEAADFTEREGETTEGEWSDRDHLIRLRDTHPSALSLMDTLLHEIGHAIYDIYRLTDDDDQERIVATMATAWTQIFRDNPALLNWMNDAVLA